MKSVIFNWILGFTISANKKRKINSWIQCKRKKREGMGSWRRATLKDQNRLKVPFFPPFDPFLGVQLKSHIIWMKTSFKYPRDFCYGDIYVYWVVPNGSDSNYIPRADITSFLRCEPMNIYLTFIGNFKWRKFKSIG